MPLIWVYVRARSSPTRPLLAATPLTYESAVSTQAALQHMRHIANDGERLNKIVYTDGVMRAERAEGEELLSVCNSRRLAVTNGLNPSSVSAHQNFDGGWRRVGPVAPFTGLLAA